MIELSLDHQSAIPLHKQVENLLRTMTQAEPWVSGECFPPEPELANRLGISRNTLRVGIDRLVQDGLLERRRRFGTRVISAGPQSSDLLEWSSFSREMAKKGIQVQEFSSYYEKYHVDKHILQLFHISPDTRCWHLRRVRGYYNEPIVVMESIFHPRCSLTENEIFNRPLFEIIQEMSGHTPVLSRECIRAINADDPFCDYLQVKKGTPLLQRQRETYGVGDKIIEYAISTYRGDRFNYTITLRNK